MDPISAFKAHVAGSVPAKEMDEQDSTGPMGVKDDATGMSPGEQAMAAIKSGDATALEEAIRRCIKSDY